MDLNKKCYFLITGASKGIGKIMAIELCKKFQEGSLAVLVARSQNGLESTKNEIIQNSNNKIECKIFPLDLSNGTETDFDNIIKSSLKNYEIEKFELAIIIHNVGSVGNVKKKAKDLSNISEIQNYYNLNVFSVTCLNSIFMKNFLLNHKLIINITSKAGIVPFKSMSLYCSGKAAREMYFRVLAEEEQQKQPTNDDDENNSKTIVLNYSPGPVDTDMVTELQQNTIDLDLRNYFKEQHDNKCILTPIQTTTKFLYIIENIQFKSGAHIDYYDY